MKMNIFDKSKRKMTFKRAHRRNSSSIIFTEKCKTSFDAFPLQKSSYKILGRISFKSAYESFVSVNRCLGTVLIL